MKYAILLVALIASVSAYTDAEVRAIANGISRGILDWLTGLVTDVLLPPVTGAIQTSAELLANITAGVAIGGLDGLLGLFGKRNAEQQKFFDILMQSLTEVINAVVMPAVNTSIQNIALLGAQLTAGLIDGGLPALQSLLGSLGKRSAEQKITLTDFLNAVIMPSVNESIQTIALLGAQLTAGLIDGGLPALQSLINSLGK